MNHVNELQVIDRHELTKLVPYSNVHVARMEKVGKFPRRIKLGPNRVGWLLSEVEAWIEGRKALRDSELELNAEVAK